MSCEQCVKICLTRTMCKKYLQKQPPNVLYKKSCLKVFPKFTAKGLRQSLFLKISCRPETCNFITKATATQVVFCEHCEIIKNFYFVEHLRTAASVSNKTTP